MSEGRFTGKVAFITGAGSGIGRATALAFATEGADLVLADSAGQCHSSTGRAPRVSTRSTIRAPNE